MASAFGHAFAAIAIRQGFSKSETLKFSLLGIFCAVFPDADAIGYKLGVPYEGFFGHRGFTHSILFAVLLGMLVTALFYRATLKNKKDFYYILFFTLCGISHDVLDAMTSGGLGVAFFSPFDNTRYFFPWRPIKVSPIGIAKFFGERGLRVIKSELVWIGIPCTIFIITARFLRNIFSEK